MTIWRTQKHRREVADRRSAPSIASLNKKHAARLPPPPDWSGPLDGSRSSKPSMSVRV